MSLRTQVGLASQWRQVVTSQRGACLIFRPRWYRFVTTTAIITDTDVIVITMHRYTPAKIVKITCVVVVFWCFLIG